MPQDNPNVGMFSQIGGGDHALERINRGLDWLQTSAENSAAKWKIIVVAFTGHGFITYPGKESCIGLPSTSEESPEVMQLRFINLEHFARLCASQANTITIIIDNSCRVYPKKDLIRNHEIPKYLPPILRGYKWCKESKLIDARVGNIIVCLEKN